MRELSFVGLSDDAATLLLSGSDGERYSVLLDERITAAVRRDRTGLGRLEMAAQGLSPKDIQTLVRAGHSAEVVAERYDVDIERVRRYEGPVLAEREYVANQAQAIEIRSDEGGRALGDLVTARLRARGINSGTLNWDAWRREDGRWTVVVTWTHNSEDGLATWAFDTVGRSVTASDDDAAALLDDTETEVDDEARPHLIGLPSVVEDLAEVEFVKESEEIPAPWVAEDDRHVTAPVAAEPEEPTPAPRRGRKAKRASVPSWDEILFGSRDPDS